MNFELLLEAERRGILPIDKAELLAEARKRGLVGAPQGGSSTNSQAVQELQRKLKAGLAGAVNTASLGFADEATGLVEGAITAPGEGTFAEGYASGRDRVRAEHLKLREAEPGVYGAGQVAGAVGTAFAPGARIATLPRGAGVAPRVAASAAEGAAFGGMYGFGEGEGQEDRFDRAQSGAMLGAIVGGATPAAGAGIERYLKTKTRSKIAAAMKGQAKSGDELMAEAAGLYDDAAAQGTTATPQQTSALADKTARRLVDEGLTGPSGEIAPGYSSAAGNQALLMDYADASMNPKQMQAVRRSLMETARKSGSEGRIGSQMVDAFDEVMEPLAPQIKQGNAVYSRAMKVKRLDEIAELAKADAGVNYSQSGYEQALRRRYNNLHKRIVEGKEKGWTPDEAAEIKRVANGGRVENFMRGMGRAAPSGIINIGMGGGMPYLIGNSIGGPGLGAALGAGTLAAGATGRKIATMMQGKNTDIVKALAATGGKMPKMITSEEPRKLIEAMLRRGLSVAPQ